MNADTLARRYQELQQYVGWTDEDARRVHELGPLLESHFPALIDDFYAEIECHPDARKVITGGPAQVERLKWTLRGWLKDLFAGPYDRDYVFRRWRVGHRHVEIGLDQVYTNVALSRLRAGLLLTLETLEAGDARVTLAARRSLNTLLDLDLTIIEDAYQAAHLALRLKQAQELALRSERLAAIGQMMTGLAHESGNALARSQACLEMLTWEVQDRPEALDLLGRVQKAQDDLKHLYEEVRGYAAPLQLAREEWNLASVWRQAWAHLAVLRQGRDAGLHEHAEGVNLRCSVDPFRLEQVFRNILENALAACADPVRIDVTCADAAVEGRPAVRVAVRDNGPGLTAEQARRIFEPFFTTKTKGTGLGMAIAKRIMEAHGGQIAVESAPGSGATVVLLLPREVP